MTDLPKSRISEGDLYANKFNVALARSQKVLESWLPTKRVHGSVAADEDSESDFKAMSESAGLGGEDEGGGVSDVLRRNRASQDKLLEQLLGKKTAQAKKKSIEDARKEPTLTKNTMSKPARPLRDMPIQSDEDEEEGRAAAFSSRKKKTRDTKTPAYAVTGRNIDDVLVPDAEPPDPREDIDTLSEMIVKEGPGDEAPDTKKRKVSSYLDEVLASKARRKKKKSKKN